TRIIEIKHTTGQKHNKTTIVREYPMAEGEPYYPVPTSENEELYQKYKSKADKLNNIYLIGRLAQYKYLNTDQVIDKSLKLFDRIKNE
ncbi:unnamed protein product, partial [marine sediment metagenome]